MLFRMSYYHLVIVEIKSLLVHDGLVLKAIIADKISNKLDFQKLIIVIVFVYNVYELFRKH